MSDTLNPILSADRWNEIIRMTTVRFRNGVELGLKNVYQDGGRMAGQEAYQSKVQELLDLTLSHDMNLTIATEDPLEGRRQQAQNELIREERLRQEVFGDAS